MLMVIGFLYLRYKYEKTHNMKQLILFFSFLFLLSFGVKAQTLSTSTSSPATGPIEVPIDVTGIGDIFSLTIYYEYDPTVITYTGYTNFFDPGTTIAITNQTSSILKILIGTFPNVTTVPDGKLLDLQFTYAGGYSDLTFGIDTDTYKSSYLNTSYSSYNFTSSDVTNGAVQGLYDDEIDGGAWNTASNWLTGRVANAYTNVTVVLGSETIIGATATANNLTIETGGQLTNNSTLNVGGDFLIESTSGGNGSFIDNGTTNVTGTTSVECYMTAGTWHGFSAPVTGQTSNELYLNGSPDVYMKEYSESGDSWSDVTSLTQALGNMAGWMVQIGGGSPHTYTFSGSLLTSSSANATVGWLGYNFIGNPFPSALDWEAASGWGGTATVGDNIWVYTGSAYSVYNRKTQTGDGSRYVAMNQGFFVEASTAGTVTVNNSAAVHNAVDFEKGAQNDLSKVTLKLEGNNEADETFIVFVDGATTGYESTFDAHKLFSWDVTYPQIFSTANNNMAINGLPLDYTGSVAIDVRGEDDSEMTISLTEANQFAEVYLEDDYTGIVTDLKLADYTFNYDADITDRFNVFFSVTDIEDNDQLSVKVYAYNNNIKVYVDAMQSTDITVTNLLGQTVTRVAANSTETIIPVNETGIYIVTVSNELGVRSEKVFIK